MQEIELVESENELFVIFDLVEEVYMKVVFEEGRALLPQVVL
jgi:hypothetical protein